METPRVLRQRPSRNPTPRLSERKKNLFATQSEVISIGSDSDDDQNNNNNDDKVKDTNGKIRLIKVLVSRTPKRISFLRNGNGSSPERMDDDVFDRLPESPPLKDSCAMSSPSRRSRRLKPTNMSPLSMTCSPSSSKTVIGKENMPTTPSQKTSGDELPALFTCSLNLNKSKTSNEEEVIEESSSDDERPLSFGVKRNHVASSSTALSPEVKIRRLAPSDRLSIPTKSFYPHSKTSPTLRSPPITIIAKPSKKNRNRRFDTKRGLMINKGVHHNIRRNPKHKLSAATATKANVMDILGTIRNEKLCKLLTEKRMERDQIENVHNILKYAKNPIDMAKPLSAIGHSYSSSDTASPIETASINETATATIGSKRCYMNGAGDISLGFSDIECSSDSDSELEDAATLPDVEKEQENRTPTPFPGRKFFKSGQSTTKKEFKVTHNIKASVCNGRMSIVQDKKHTKKKIKLRNTPVNEFSSEQAKVDEILQNLDVVNAPEEVGSPLNQVNQIELPGEEIRVLPAQEDNEFFEFRQRLPYNTSDPEIIEQQNILLDFLITNKICTERNFTIFIADPENHKDEAQQLVDQLVVVLAGDMDDMRQRLPYNTTNPVEIDRQRTFLEFLIENNLCTEENFQIFIADYANRHEEADRIITEIVATTHNISAEDLERELRTFNQHSSVPAEAMELEIPDQNKQNPKVLEASSDKFFPIFYPGRCQPIVRQKSSRKLSKTWNAGTGSDQYQIDAGQKEFGARQCKQCGLVYTVHEPEEERLHKDFHSSLHILKFKSWIDEDIVQIYPEWGVDGRIIRISEKSHGKRQERLKDVLQLVDKELGFSSYILPTHFKAYFALRQCQIVGICLTEPLTKAHRYISMNGVDCCTEETFEAKCGISRIWVSPLHRRFHIASKLIRAVQLYTIFSEEIPLDKIAFSAPTEDGKRFAKSVTRSDNFLVYQ